MDRPDLVLEAILSTLTSEDVVLDIGANIGTFALRCAGWNFSVHAFEPLLTSANHLEISAHVNGFSNLHVVRKVVSNSSKEHVQICYDLVNFGHAGVPVWGNPVESGSCPHGTSAADAISTTLGTCMHVRVWHARIACSVALYVSINEGFFGCTALDQTKNSRPKTQNNRPGKRKLQQTNKS